MENEIRSSTAGRIAAVRVSPRQTVDKGDTLLVIEPLDAGSSS